MRQFTLEELRDIADRAEDLMQNTPNESWHQAYRDLAKGAVGLAIHLRKCIVGDMREREEEKP